MQRIPIIYKRVLTAFILIILGYLSIASFVIFADMKLDTVSEKTIIRPAIFPLSILLLLILIFVFIKNKQRIENADSKKLLHTLLAFDFLLCIFWIVVSNTHEGADQAQVLYSSKQFATGNFSRLAPDQYMGMFPYQLPLALLYEPFYFLFGDVTPFLWQFINALLICGIQYFLYLIVNTLTNTKQYVNYFLIVQFLELPIILYVAFIYGTVIGLFLSLLSLFFLIKYSDSKRLLDLLLCCCSIACACLLRNNYLIFLIALSIISILYACNSNRKILLFIPISLLLFFAGKQAVFEIYEYRSGVEIPEGEPVSLNIAMGLSANEERAAGWYNGYTWDTYLELNCNPDKAHEFAMSQIDKSFSEFVSSPAYAASFFSEKINSMWLSPDFQGLWNNEHHGHYVSLAPIINNLFHGTLHSIALICLNSIQFLIYFGSFLCFWVHKKNMDWKHYSFSLIFIGGFLFHLFWEAKAQYVIVYYVLLFPYAAAGLKWIADKTEQLAKKQKK